MQITAKINQLLPLQNGEGKNGPWKKQEIIVETDGKFPKKICIACWGDLADNELLKDVGKSLLFNIDIESREYNGKWYTDIKAWKIEDQGYDSQNNSKIPVIDIDNSFEQDEVIPF